MKSKTSLLLTLAALLLMPLTAIHAADDLSGDRVTAGALGLSQSPLPALHAAEATTSQEIEVVNLWPNRLIGDGKLPVEEQRTRTNIGTKKIGTFDFRSARSGEASDQREMNHKANS